MMSEYTDQDLKEFKRLVILSGSQHQMDRIEARLEMPRFIKEHGKTKCDAMWSVINRSN